VIIALVFSQVNFSSALTPPGLDRPATLREEIAIEALTERPDVGAEYDGYIVKFAEAALSDIDTVAEEKVAERVIDEDIAVVRQPADVLAFAEPETVDSIEPNYRISIFEPGDEASSGIEIFSPDIESKDFPTDAPADPLYRSAQNYQWGLKEIKSNQLWYRNLRGDGITVAILDTGLNAAHEDIDTGRIVLGRNFSSDTAGGAWSDNNGHGSYVAGIMGAKIDNRNNYGEGVGMAGITDQVSFVIFKVLNASGSGYLEDILTALTALANDTPKVDVINLSLGHPGTSNAEEAVVQKLLAKGIIVVAAAGNDGQAEGKRKNIMMYPAGYEGVISVGSVNSAGRASAFSTKNSSVDVSAPGENMTGLSNTAKNTYKVGGDGTSFAAPVVAAAAAIAKGHSRDTDGATFMEQLRLTVNDAGPAGRDDSYGYGVLDMNRLINLLYGPVALPMANVRYHVNGGKSISTTKNVYVGSAYGALPIPTRKGYSFTGWYNRRTKGNRVTAATVADRAGTITLYARWAKNYTVTLNANRGKVSKKRVTVITGKKYGTLPKASRAKYRFLGWYTKKSGGAKVTGSTAVKLKKNQILYAHWKHR
jgi:uncharacterized repeat protein (TIGR02543 family)